MKIPQEEKEESQNSDHTLRIKANHACGSSKTSVGWWEMPPATGWTCEDSDGELYGTSLCTFDMEFSLNLHP